MTPRERPSSETERMAEWCRTLDLADERDLLRYQRRLCCASIRRLRERAERAERERDLMRPIVAAAMAEYAEISSDSPPESGTFRRAAIAARAMHEACATYADPEREEERRHPR